jgi:molybdopterin/thiamine biosynthesis adenylyltransferase/ubiquitin-protein ligase
MKWALRDPARFLRERAELERLESEVDWLQALSWRVEPDLTVKVDFDFEVHGRQYNATLTYPDLFPETPAYIRPRDGTQRWTAHQYGEGGSLCLEWRADNWNSSVTGADLVRSAHKLLSSETHPEHPAPVASAHRQTIGQEARGSDRRFVLTQAMKVALAAIPSGATRRLKAESLLHSSASVLLVREIESDSGSMDAIGDVPAGARAYFPLCSLTQTGRVFSGDAFDERLHFNTATELLQSIRDAGVDVAVLPAKDSVSGKYPDRIVMLIGTNASNARVFDLDGTDDSTTEYGVLLAGSAIRQEPEHLELASKRVALVGLGSIGSKIAVSLARAGVKRFLLVDDDVLLPGNLCRHELAWESVGLHKVEGVREMLERTVPGVEVRTRIHRVAGQESALVAAAALKDIGACDLIIDATANPNAFVRLAATVLAQGRPLVWGEVFAGGMGGLIARSRPGHDPNPLAVRDSINEYLDRQPPAPLRDAAGYDGDERDPAIAYDCEVTQVACAMTQLAIDTALQRIPSQFPSSAYLLGFRRDWIFDQPFDTHPIAVAGPDWSATTVQATDEDRTEAARLLLDMVAGAGTADTDCSG